MPPKSKQNSVKSNSKNKPTSASSQNINDNSKPPMENATAANQPPLVAEKSSAPPVSNVLAPASKDEQIGAENVNKNPYIDVVQKRLRSLIKRRVKYLQCEEMLKNGNQALNQDQIQALERKNEVEFAIQEFESIIKNLNAVENDELKSLKMQKKVQETERDEAVAKAVKETEEFYASSIISLLQFFRLVHYQNVSIVQMSEIENEAVTHFRDLLNHLAGDALIEEKRESTVREVLAHVKKLHQGDDEVVHRPVSNNEVEEESGGGISYSNIHSLAISPPIAENLDETLSTVETVQDTTAEEIVTVQQNNVQADHAYSEDIEIVETRTMPPGGFKFMVTPDNLTGDRVPSINDNNTTQFNKNPSENFDENQPPFLQITEHPLVFQHPPRPTIVEQQQILPPPQQVLPLPNNDQLQHENFTVNNLQNIASIPTQAEETLSQVQESSTTTQQIALQHQQISSVNINNDNILKQTTTTISQKSHEQPNSPNQPPKSVSANNSTDNTIHPTSNYSPKLPEPHIVNHTSQHHIPEVNHSSHNSNSPNSVHIVAEQNQHNQNVGEKRRDPRPIAAAPSSSHPNPHPKDGNNSRSEERRNSNPIQRRNSNKRYSNQQRQNDRRQNNYQAQNGQENFGRNGSPSRIQQTDSQNPAPSLPQAPQNPANQPAAQSNNPNNPNNPPVNPLAKDNIEIHIEAIITEGALSEAKAEITIKVFGVMETSAKATTVEIIKMVDIAADVEEVSTETALDIKASEMATMPLTTTPSNTRHKLE
ncbi:3960_t:CDS:2 [Ambispora gerdemannii]|uniref:3960_t:CDS:1 n=1 Tax=Ambispora gerdemannii TaxID=144530 RepID=A0A9N8ZWC0_9GLOM|nr:3960_t:CDS:2 [Ambispora gerdemannii]